MRYFLIELNTRTGWDTVLVKAKDSDSAAVKIINLGLGTNPKVLASFDPMELDKNIFKRLT